MSAFLVNGQSLLVVMTTDFIIQIFLIFLSLFVFYD